ncbi:methyltransferase family protein [Geodermatophilus normandii]|uniref:Methyltransferase family protein n=1 Tax=Geodermatophilus normandii TaxID=1137989 RepID=A0A317QQ34_9ACTN|nr:class I SAM-dependent methyltransferase [Geodermatophilus normandii]PWW23750.1 methyltransferase family protein [Geodermatophilus normandii]
MTTTREARALLRAHYPISAPKIRAYNAARLSVLPVPWVLSLLDDLEGTVLCLGCGYGTLETVMAATHPKLEFAASDFNERRIAVARSTVRGLPNISFSTADATQELPDESYDNVFLSDLLHHLPAGEQEPLLQRLWQVVRPGGALVMKDLDVRPRWKCWWNHLHDRVVAGPPLTYLPASSYHAMLTRLGARVQVAVPRTRLPYAHYALIAVKPADGAAGG